MHVVHCEDTPIFADVAYDMSWSPTLPVPVLWEDPFRFGRWVCYFGGQPGHYGGYVNGPTHYCPRVRAVVMEDA